MNINALLSSSEGKTLEFKRDMSSIKPILKTLVACNYSAALQRFHTVLNPASWQADNQACSSGGVES